MSVPSQLDSDWNVTFHSVGVALSQWESLESRLALLFSYLSGCPHSADAIIKYGRKGRIFTERMRVLTEAAVQYFQRHPDQANQGDCDAVCKRVKELSHRRHQIAHGVVGGFYVCRTGDALSDTAAASELEYGVVPPSYAIAGLTRRESSYYCYGSAAVLHFAQAFADCAAKVNEYRLHIPDVRKFEGFVFLPGVELCMIRQPITYQEDNSSLRKI